MNFNSSRLNYLLEKQISKTITQEEHLELFEQIKNEETKAYILAFMDNHYKNLNPTADVHDFDWDTIYSLSKLSPSAPSKIKAFNFLKYAAVLICATGLSFIIYNQISRHNLDKTSKIKKEIVADVKPGGNKAILTLSNGKKIDLENLNPNQSSKDGNVTIKKNKDGLLVYNFLESEQRIDNNAFNTISTPRGGNFQVTLPDGSNVWLNALTTIKFPVSFKSTERIVDLIDGEAYFEVAKNKTQPFYVNAKKGIVKVLGTHFNVENIRENEKTKITLLEGSVKISKEDNSKILKPGEQGSYNKNSSNIILQNVDTEEVVDWKNGLFVFNNTSIKDIMLSLSNWYDVNVVYTQNIPNHKYTGILSRNNNLSKLIAFLEKAGDLSFEIKDKTIYVNPQKK